MHDAQIIERKKLESAAKVAAAEAQGRWPANVCHDGSDEVVVGFPTTGGGGTPRAKSPNDGSHWNVGGERSSVPGGATSIAIGSAARFFYSAKASKADRAGSKHPTVKPVSLMEWLCMLVTPPGGTVLDPFAGSGTTGIAAQNKGFNVVLCEREDEYIADIRRRFGHVDAPSLSPEIIADTATV
jgi:site-specific DNA-methyltransferase (adenine-specific)